MKINSLQYSSLLIAACLTLCWPVAYAAESTADEAEINIWVDNASLNLFISQLASISGKTPQIDGVLPGIVSGRFKGSIEQTLNTLSDDFPVLFDVEEDVLRAVDKSSLSNVSIALPDSGQGDMLKSELDHMLLPGNNIEYRKDSIHVSGHPAFVRRSAGLITAKLADTEALGNVETVVDAGANEMINDITTMKDANDTIVDANAVRHPILSVTDIPGYTTF